MADATETLNGEVNAETIHDLQSLLSSEGRDFLVRNNGDQVKTADLAGKIIGLYFSASWCGPCRRFTPIFSEVYKELYAQGDFEAVFISGDEDEESFKEYFAKMPWLAIPFSDSTTRDRLNELFDVNGIPHLVILGGNGKVLSDNGVELVREYGVEAFPFSPQKLKEIKEEEEAARRNQSLTTLLVTQTRDFLISNDGNKVLVSEIQGKMVGLYFCFSSHKPCQEFTLKLVEMYNKLKDKGDEFEVVLISLDDDEQSYVEILKSIPFLALPFKDKICEKLARYFELSTIPTLVIIGSDGKTVNSNAAELVEEHGIQAYPFTPEKLEELQEIERKRLESQTLESLLVSGERDFVIGKGGVKVPVSELVGKHILLYFSAHWCPPCRAFLPKLTEVYHEIKAKDPAFELIFISSDRDQGSFDDYFSSMPWLALPFGDERKKFLSRTFKILGIPSLVAIGPTGKTITTEARDLVAVHGSDAYPFTEEHLKVMEAKIEEMAKGWPEKVKHDLHTEHELNLKRQRVYNCDGCGMEGRAWSYYCKECDFDLHPKCALEEEKKEDDERGENKDGHGHEAATNEGWVCDGDVCKKA
ncbi:putative nucleoredoxin 1 [Cinnamomum micranthum f. kanehirae]|uniref:protein-disulfide reductase n=1 Tax=Cinnamomum micranthum f. kanehirae TaxID=337451 RepID=A0A443NLU6_9MAGN|nr:putative nucleoredoxin 1 [Cinnamomum micranthum f. kanehirae]